MGPSLPEQMCAQFTPPPRPPTTDRVPLPCVGDFECRAVPEELGRTHFRKLPVAVATETAGLGAAHRLQAQLIVEFVDANADQGHVGKNAADVGKSEILLEPESRL